MKLRKTLLLKSAVFIIGFIILTLCIFWLPNIARETAEIYPEYAHLRYPVLIGMYITAIPFYYALYQTLKLLNYIEFKSAFSDLAVTSLRHIKHCAWAVIIQYILGFCYLVFQNAMHPGVAILGMAVVFTSMTISLFAALLEELLLTALEIKSENDLTI